MDLSFPFDYSVNDMVCPVHCHPLIFICRWCSGLDLVTGKRDLHGKSGPQAHLPLDPGASTGSSSLGNLVET